MVSAPDPTAVAASNPESIGGGPNDTVPMIAAGGFHTCALLDTGQISCWGFGGSGRLGTGGTTDLSTPSAPITLPTNTTATAITTGNAHTCALLNTGQISCWGFGGNGQLGTGDNTSLSTPSAPIALPANTTATAITAGTGHTCALLNTGQISCWGFGGDGQLGTGDNTSLSTPSAPITLPTNTTATAITAGNFHTCALLNTGQISCWGFGSSGRLGTGDNTSLSTPSAPITLPTNTTATAITAGSTHTCALLNTGQISCWGAGGDGRLGTGDTNNLSTPSAPITLPANTTATAITAGTFHTCALLNTGQISCWGAGGDGQLGTGDTNNLSTPSAPITLPTNTTATAITAGSTHTCALLNTGQISCWGNNFFGQLGTGNTTDLSTPSAPITLPTNTTATAITTGGLHTCALLNTGQISCWGAGGDGQLGTGNTTDLSTPSAPITLPTNTTATAITTRGGHTCALLNTGHISCWGSGGFGQLGTGDNTSLSTPSAPITLPTNTTATAITTGTFHTCALLNTGQISCWGAGSFGQLGNGTTTSSNVPTVAGVPAAPTSAVATASSEQAQLSWTPGAESVFGPVTAWTIEQSTDTGTTWAPSTLAAPPAAGDTTTTVTGLTNGIEYLFRVAGVNTVGTGPFGVSNPVTPTTPPVPTVTTTAGSPTNTLPIPFRVSFDQDVTGFDTTDITIDGATIDNLQGSGTTYTFDATPTADGTITATIDAGAATNTNNQANTASNTVTVDYDTTGPVATIDIAPGQADPTETLPVTFSITFDEAPVDFDAADLDVGGTAGAATATLTGADTSYTATIDTVASAGTITIDLAAGTVTDAVGNANGATTIITNTVTLDDNTGPTIVVPAGGVQADTDPGQPGATVTYTVTATDPEPTPTLPRNLAALGAAPTVDCTPASGSFFTIGVTTVNCAATDAAGNTSTDTFDVTITDNEDPTIDGTNQSFDLPVDTTSGPISYILPTATDNSGSATISCTPPPGTSFNAGATTIECTATDPSGNTTAATYTVTALTSTTPTTPPTTAPPVTVPSGGLPALGSSPNTAITLALALLAIGTLTILTTRRRRHT